MTDSEWDKFIRGVERQAYVWFGRRLDSDIELEQVHEHLGDAFRATFTDRFVDKGKAESMKWWKDEGGKAYAQKAVQRFARELNRLGTKKPNKDDLDEAYKKAKKKLNESLRRAAAKKKKKGAFSLMAPVLCEQN